MPGDLPDHPDNRRKTTNRSNNADQAFDFCSFFHIVKHPLESPRLYKFGRYCLHSVGRSHKHLQETSLINIQYKVRSIQHLFV